jgi:hypothetical protein
VKNSTLQHGRKKQSSGSTDKTMPIPLQGYLNTNNTEVTSSFWPFLGLRRGSTPSSLNDTRSQQQHEDEDDDEREGDFDIRLGEEDKLHSVEEDIKRTRLFQAVDELRQTVNIQRVPLKWLLECK